MPPHHDPCDLLQASPGKPLCRRSASGPPGHVTSIVTAIADREQMKRLRMGVVPHTRARMAPILRRLLSGSTKAPISFRSRWSRQSPSRSLTRSQNHRVGDPGTSRSVAACSPSPYTGAASSCRIRCRSSRRCRTPASDRSSTDRGTSSDHSDRCTAAGASCRSGRSSHHMAGRITTAVHGPRAAAVRWWTVAI